MSAFEDFIQTELPRRPWVIDGGNQETILVRRGGGPRQSVWVGLSEGEVLGKVGGVVQGVTISGIPKSFVHTQGTSNGTWTIVHNKNSLDVMIQIYDENNKVIIPEDIAVTDLNTVTITFSAAQDGRAVLMFAS